MGRGVDPWQLARVLAAAKDPTGARRGLQEVRVYRGMPDQARDEPTFRAFRSQTAEWKRRGGDRLLLRTRKIKYPPPYTDEKPREKGIDVWLAVDLVEMAIRHTVDRAVVVSTDTDLIPALRLATETREDNFVEVVGWEGLGDAAGLLYIPGHRITKRPLRRDLYEALRDDTDLHDLDARPGAGGGVKPHRSWGNRPLRLPCEEGRAELYPAEG